MGLFRRKPGGLRDRIAKKTRVVMHRKSINSICENAAKAGLPEKNQAAFRGLIKMAFSMPQAERDRLYHESGSPFNSAMEKAFSGLTREQLRDIRENGIPPELANIRSFLFETEVGTGNRRR